MYEWSQKFPQLSAEQRAAIDETIYEVFMKHPELQTTWDQLPQEFFDKLHELGSAFVSLRTHALMNSLHRSTN